MSYENWRLTVDDRIATLTLNRAKYKNRITVDTLYELRDITAEIAGRKDIWAVVLEGAGEHFTVGFDVNAIGSSFDQTPEQYGPSLRERQLCIDVFEALPKPTIAKIRGYCLGAGMILTACCDFRIASENARFGLPEVKRGIAVVMGTQRITRLIGLAATKELTLLAEFIDVTQAQRMGFVNTVVVDDQLDATVDALAEKFRHLPPRTVGVAKRIVDEGYHMTIRESQDLEIDLQSQILDSPDLREAIQSFFEKREPRFTGE